MVNLDRDAIRAGAAADLAILVPVVAIYTVLRATGAVSGDVPTVITAVLAGLFAPLVGGTVAGRRGGHAPLTNSTVAVLVAVVAFIVFRLADAAIRGVGVNVASIAALAIISMSLGLAGGYAGWRSTRQTRQP